MGNGSGVHGEERRIRTEGLGKQTCMEGGRLEFKIPRRFSLLAGLCRSFTHSVIVPGFWERRATKLEVTPPPLWTTPFPKTGLQVHVIHLRRRSQHAAAAATAAYNFSLSAARSETNLPCLTHRGVWLC